MSLVLEASQVATKTSVVKTRMGNNPHSEKEEHFSLCQFSDTTLDRKGQLCFSTHLCLGYDSTASSFIRPRALHSVILTGERLAADQNTRLGWIEPAKLKLMGFDLSDFRIYFNLINLSLN